MIATSCSPRDLDIVVSTKLVKSVRYFSRDFAGRPGPDCQLLHDLLPESSHAAHWMVKVDRSGSDTRQRMDISHHSHGKNIPVFCFEPTNIQITTVIRLA